MLHALFCRLGCHHWHLREVWTDGIERRCGCCGRYEDTRPPPEPHPTDPPDVGPLAPHALHEN